MEEQVDIKEVLTNVIWSTAQEIVDHVKDIPRDAQLTIVMTVLATIIENNDDKSKAAAIMDAMKYNVLKILGTGDH